MHKYMCGVSENLVVNFSHKTSMSGLQGLPRKVAMVFVQGTLNFREEVKLS